MSQSAFLQIFEEVSGDSKKLIPYHKSRPVQSGRDIITVEVTLCIHPKISDLSVQFWLMFQHQLT